MPECQVVCDLLERFSFAFPEEAETVGAVPLLGAPAGPTTAELAMQSNFDAQPEGQIGKVLTTKITAHGQLHHGQQDVPGTAEQVLRIPL